MNKSLIIYALSLFALLTLLKILEFNYLIRDLSIEIYLGLIALIFMLLGIWVGFKVLKDRKNKERSQNAFSEINLKLVKELQLSTREMEVLQLIAEGYSNQEIAEKLFLSISTVKTHSSNLFSKLDVKRRTQAIQKAKKLRIIS